ncbi:hypothetical protein EWM64_g1538 [Hericium alpestre]|uniref:Major facilitator superfamily (MFS) profile domain-containing protein n=1 Tax=Hericium alpestre TaxID=135208 RepID=A0A4Z0A645_9AGAM|nr:hypothetical protein EWM64_g1538 [Hericium alpestre]
MSSGAVTSVEDVQHTPLTTLPTTDLHALDKAYTSARAAPDNVIPAMLPADLKFSAKSMPAGSLHRLVVTEATTSAAPSVLVGEDQQPPADDVPNGSYGWVIVAACSVITFFYTGLGYSWGVVQARLSQSHNLGSDAALSFVGSTCIAFVSFTALINARLIRWLGTRNSALLACSFLGLGQFLNGWSVKSYGGLFVTNGIIMGFGSSMCFMFGVLNTSPLFLFTNSGITRHADRSLRSTSNAGEVWQMVGIAWAFRILGLITLSVTLPTALLLKERTRRAAAGVEWKLFRDPKFILLFVGSGIATFPLLVPPFFIPLYANSVGASTSLASGLLAVFNFSSAVVRFGFGLLCDRVGPISALSLALILNSVSLLAIWPTSVSVAPLVVFIVLNGAGNGGFFACIPSIVGYLNGQSRVSSALAMVVTGWASGYLLGSPVAGWLLEAYGGSAAGRVAFRPTIYFAGSLSVASTGLILTMRQLLVKKIFVYA